MKTIKIFIISLTLLCSSIANASFYTEAKQMALDDGYTIVDEKYGDISEGGYIYDFRTMYAKLNYIIVAESQDADVEDVDIIVYNEDGVISHKDIDKDSIALINFTAGFTRTVKIEVINYKSKTPKYQSRCRYFVAYK